MNIARFAKAAANRVTALRRFDPSRHTIGSEVDLWWPGIHGRGKLTIGSGSTVQCRIDFDLDSGHVLMGERCFVGRSHLVCSEAIHLGDDVIISWGVTIVDHDSHALSWDLRSKDVEMWKKGKKDWTHVSRAPVRLEKRCWVGFGASILKGVTVGEGAVVGARAVVTKDVPPYSVVVGNPAKAVRSLVEEGS